MPEDFKVICPCGRKFVKYSSFDKQCPDCQRKSGTSQQRPQKKKAMSKPTVRQKALRKPKQIVRKKKAAKKRKSTLQKRKDNPRSNYWKKKADEAWGKLIHQFSGCIIGVDCAGNLEAHHLISRANVMTRHDPNNGVLLCSKHHKYCTKLSAHGAPMAFAQYIQEIFPSMYQWVSENKYKTGKPDYKQAYEDLVKNLKNLKDNL